MRLNRYFLFLLAALALPARAQYGSGVELQIPRATGAITLDGNDSEADWAGAPEVDLTANWDTYGIPEPDIAATGKVLWGDGALYVFIRYLDYQEFYWGPPGNPDLGEHLLVGVDLAHVNSDSIDNSFAGWPDNLPNLGPVAYKVTGALGEGDAGITANFGFGDGIAPVDSGWVAGQIYIDEANFEWGVEMAIYGDEVTIGAELGFNLGGSAASQEWADENEGDGNYSYYSWLICDPLPPGERYCNLPGGTVMSDAGSFATLLLAETVANEPGVTAAEGYSLSPNSPNPFRSTTALAYVLPRTGDVRLSVYDLLGREVAVLDSGTRIAGEHPVVFDASVLPAGVYTVRLDVDDAVVATRRVMHTD